MNTESIVAKSLKLLEQAYDPDRFAGHAHDVVELAASVLRSSLARQGKVLSLLNPDDATARFRELAADADPLELLIQVAQHSIKLHHPRYIGHQISPPLPISAAAGLLIDLLNNGMGVYEMGVAGTAIERALTDILAEQFGFGDSSDGFLTSGGSLANLTALLAARARQTDDQVWSRGSSHVQHVVLVSESAHYCVDRAVRIMGLGDAGICKIPTNDQFQMQTDLLDQVHDQLVDQGRKVIAVVGSSCCTSSGSYDDLDRIADFCQPRNIWFHVDGAHGAAVTFSRQHRHKINGIERADSVTLDFHKLLMTPAITSALIFRDGNEAYRTFSLQAEYLFSESDEQEWFNLARRTFECTKQMMGLKALSIVNAHGPEVFQANIDCLFGLTEQFADLVEQHLRFELAIRPQSNILCFRFLPAKPGEADSLNEQIREQLVRDGDFYIVQTTLRNQRWLRCTVSNPFTRRSDFEALLTRLQEIADGITG